jgi:2-hydroxy-3-keto-5-methylthiopentenyl-1-phosphate phosphatase
MRCQLLMAASVLKSTYQNNANIREKGKDIHSCVRTRSNNFGADKSVTVPARASSNNVMRDMIDEDGGS